MRLVEDILKNMSLEVTCGADSVNENFKIVGVIDEGIYSVTFLKDGKEGKGILTDDMIEGGGYILTKDSLRALIKEKGDYLAKRYPFVEYFVEEENCFKIPLLSGIRYCKDIVTFSKELFSSFNLVIDQDYFYLRLKDLGEEV